MKRVGYYKGKIKVIKRSKTSPMGSSVYEFLENREYEHNGELKGKIKFKKGELVVCLDKDIW